MRVDHTKNDGVIFQSSSVNKEEDTIQSKQKMISLLDEDHVNVNFSQLDKKKNDDLINATLRAVRFGMQKHSQAINVNNNLQKADVSLVQKAFYSAEEFLTFATTEKKVISSDKDVVNFLKQARSSLRNEHNDVSVLSSDLHNAVKSFIKEE